MLRRVFKAAGRTLLGIVALCVVLYVIAVAVNWRDQEPSASAVRFANLYSDRPVVADDDNAYVYAMGFGGDNQRLRRANTRASQHFWPSRWSGTRRRWLRSDLTPAFPPRSVYNPIGQMLLGMGLASHDNYPKQVGDVEGVRRAALAAVTTRAANVTAHDVPASLATSPLRNPYNNRPFDWDGEAVLFHGLEAGERGEHRLDY